MTETPKTKPAFIIRDFADAGTSQRFTKGEVVEFEEAVFANHEAAGLVRVPTGEDPAPASSSTGAAASASNASASARTASSGTSLAAAETKPAEPATAKTKS